jgi:hypothetical protein
MISDRVSLQKFILRENLVSWGASKTVTAVLGLTGLLVIGIAHASQLREQNSAFDAGEFRQAYGDITASSPSPWSEPTFQQDAIFADPTTMQPVGLDLTQIDSSKDSLPDPRQRVPEPRSLALLGSGLILLRVVLRARTASPRLAQTRYEIRSISHDYRSLPISAQLGTLIVKG